MSGFIINVESNHRVWYLIGTIVFVLIGLGLAIGGFASGNVGSGVVGVVMTVAAVVLLIDAIANLSD